MFNSTSNYALNKKAPNAIVYPTATGEIIRVTREDFATEEEFLAFKAWSDENYHLQDNGDVTEDRHTTFIESVSDAALAVPADEVIMEHRQIQAEKHRKEKEMVVNLKGMLTDVQFRRLWMYKAEGKTEEEIAAIEGVAQQQISKSLRAATKKIKKFSPQE